MRHGVIPAIFRVLLGYTRAISESKTIYAHDMGGCTRFSFGKVLTVTRENFALVNNL